MAVKQQSGIGRDAMDTREDEVESIEDLLDDEAFAAALINALNQNFVLEVEASLRARRAN